MAWLLLLLVAIVIMVFLPGVPTTIMLIILGGILLFIIGSLIYSYVKGGSGSGSGSAPACNTCAGSSPTIQPCSNCSNMPCQCSHVLPGQTRCPMCPGLLGQTAVSGAVGCNACGRVYKCPGCLMS